MSEHYPLTNEQLQQIRQDLAEMKVRAEEIAHLMEAGFGEGHQKTIRAGELNAAVQRLQWEFERDSVTTAT
jgi:hypothetical protein